MLNYKQIWHGIKPIRWLNKFNLTWPKSQPFVTYWTLQAQKASLMTKGLPTSNTLCPSKVFLHHAVEHKARNMSYQRVEHSPNSICNTLSRSSPKGWSFGAWRILVLYFTIWVNLLFKPNIFSVFSLLYLSLYWFFFPFPMVIFFKLPYISNNSIFQRIIFF